MTSVPPGDPRSGPLPRRDRRGAAFSALLVLLHAAALALALGLDLSTVRSALIGVNGAGVLVNAWLAWSRWRAAKGGRPSWSTRD